MSRLSKIDPPPPVRRYERERAGELLHVDVKQLAYVSHEFALLCRALQVRQLRTKPYTPRTNGKVERVIQTLLREWAYRFTYNSSDERKRWLKPFFTLLQL